MKEDKEEYHKIDEFSGAFKRLWLTILTLLKLWEYWENSSAFSTSIFLLVGESGMCKYWKKLRDFLKMVEEILGILPGKEMEISDEAIKKAGRRERKSKKR